jgi:transposase-like protein
MKSEVRHGATEVTREFKVEAVKLITECGVTVAQAARE